MKIIEIPNTSWFTNRNKDKIYSLSRYLGAIRDIYSTSLKKEAFYI